jgi:hypothetical protein
VGKGTGLGLTVAYAIVQEHGGRIPRRVGAGRGASFFVELPVTGGTLREAADAAADGRGAATPGGRRVLVVEDEPALASAVSDSLTDAGFRGGPCGDGEEALARVAERPYDLVICDLKMPRVDGMAFYARLPPRRRRWPRG